MKKHIIIILIVAVMLGYAREFMPSGQTVGFVFDSLRIDSQWYWFILFKDIRSVLLVLALWLATPKKSGLLKFAISIFGVMILFVPINFVLFYSAPFHILAFTVKLAVSIGVGFLIMYFNDRDTDNSSFRD